jgi:hypothetical protein
VARFLGGIAVLARTWASSLRTLDVRQVRRWFWEKEGIRNEEHLYLIPDSRVSLPENPPHGTARASAGTYPVRALGALAPPPNNPNWARGAAICDTTNRVRCVSFSQSPETEVLIPSYIADLDDALATRYQSTNDGSGWKLETHVPQRDLKVFI